MNPPERPSSSRTLAATLLTLTLCLALAFVVLIGAGTLAAYLPTGAVGMVLYVLGGTLFFFIAVRMRSRSRQVTGEHGPGQGTNGQPVTGADAMTADSLETMRRRMRNRKRRRLESDTAPERETQGIHQ